jgi:hypothetical protein
MPATLITCWNVRRTLWASSGVPHGRGEHQPVVLPQRPGLEPFLRLPDLVRLQGCDDGLSKLQRPPRFLGLDVSVGADGAPDGHVRWHGRSCIRVAVEVHVIPAQRMGLLGSAPGHQAQHDVCVQARTLGGLDQRLRLAQRERLRRPALLALRRPDERADVTAHKIPSLRIADGPDQAVVGVLHGPSRSRSRQLRQGLPDVGKPPAARVAAGVKARAGAVLGRRSSAQAARWKLLAD